MKKNVTSKGIALFLLIIFPLLILLYDTIHEKQTAQKKPHQLHVLATTTILADVIKNVLKGIKNEKGEDSFLISTLMKTGVDPHSYEPTLQDAQHCNKADIIFVSGLNLEGSMGHIFASLKQTKDVYTAADALKASQIRRDTHYSAGVDPHWWCNPRLMIQVVNHMVQTFQELDPKHAESYAQNGKAYLKKLEALCDYVDQKVKAFPKKKLLIVTTHDFLGYFAHAYQDKVSVLALQGFSTARDIALTRRKYLTDEIIKNKVKVIFLETSVNDKGVKSLVQSCKMENYSLKISDEPLYGDSLGPSHTPSGNYIGMIKHNVNILTQNVYQDGK